METDFYGINGKVVEIDRKPFKCPVCSKAYATLANKKGHVKSSHKKGSDE